MDKNMKKQLTQEEILEKAHKDSEVWSAVGMVGAGVMLIGVLLPCFLGGTAVAENVGKAILVISGSVTLFAFAKFKNASYIIHKAFIERIADELLDDGEDEAAKQSAKS